MLNCFSFRSRCLRPRRKQLVGSSTGGFPDANPPVKWSKDENIVWKSKLPGHSLASPVVVRQRVFVISEPSALTCLSVEDGKIEWQRSHEYADAFGEAKGRKIEPYLKMAQDVRKQKDELNRERGEEGRPEG